MMTEPAPDPEWLDARELAYDLAGSARSEQIDLMAASLLDKLEEE